MYTPHCLTLSTVSMMCEPDSPKRNAWKMVLKIIIAVATAIGGGLGLQSCM